MAGDDEQLSAAQAADSPKPRPRRPRPGGLFRPLPAPSSRRPRQSMHGFEAHYTDIADYIVAITRRVWEEKEAGYLYHTYQHNVVIHEGDGDTHGVEDVVAGTVQLLAAFPDCKIYAHDVIWTGDDRSGFHTSHVTLTVAHNSGYTVYGPPTGRYVAWRAIACCVARENRIFEAWLLRDESSLIQQLGYDPSEVAEQHVRALGGSGPAQEQVGAIGRTLGQYPPPAMPPRAAGAFDVEDFVRRAYHEVWNWRLLNKIRDYYAPGHVCYTSGGRKLQGQTELTAFVLSLLSMFPDAGITVEDVYWNGDAERGYRAAVRWTLLGTHSGVGVYGAPSGARVRVMGLSQHHIKHERFVYEQTLFDEMGLIKQITARRLAIRE